MFKSQLSCYTVYDNVHIATINTKQVVTLFFITSYHIQHAKSTQQHITFHMSIYVCILLKSSAIQLSLPLTTSTVYIELLQVQLLSSFSGIARQSAIQHTQCLSISLTGEMGRIQVLVKLTTTPHYR